ncbi:MAG: hypothetical protein IV100_16700 [Myxococcales bacterium]|nr:hypothetical protein [Myxococcales bacterium]
MAPDTLDEDTSACVPTGIESCNGVDDDCDGLTDQGGGLALDGPAACGVCGNDCTRCATHCVEVTCAVDTAGEPGTCGCAACAPGWVNLDGGADCETSCTATDQPEIVCDGRDDDCDGATDEDVSPCDPASCGGCGVACEAKNGIPGCEALDALAACGPKNAICTVSGCTCTGPGDCWYDLDGAAGNGCEYACFPTGEDLCDGIDNDCNGLVDDGVDLALGQACPASGLGRCGAGTGVTVCAFGHVVCAGTDLVTPGTLVETCNGLDDDCDGVTDDGATDAGIACGTSALAPCSLGWLACVNGDVVCQGAHDPAPELCNGLDDDCDGVVDLAGDQPPLGMGAPCDVPKLPPEGASSPCRAGTRSCVAGTAQCIGAIHATAVVDACGDDTNCDGALTGQPDRLTDPAHCGDCGHDCAAGAVHAIWSCQGGQCLFGGCETGYVDLDGDQACEYACVSQGPKESCNGVDDNCNGVVDEELLAPSPSFVCQHSVAATAPECTSEVQVSCVNGAWSCQYPTGVCAGGCSADDEICDLLDNDCDGALNENVPSYGHPCASDEGLATGHGPCRTTGLRICNGPSALKCSAAKADCAGLPGGCVEECDTIDNDCDGLTDEAYTASGPAASTFVKPAVTRIATGLWMFTYEASRPTATAQTAGSGNGYWTSAPAGIARDRTRACSKPTRLPWSNVTPNEVSQVCAALGGRACTRADFQLACGATSTCNWAYNPRGLACTLANTPTKYCNLGSTFDGSTSIDGDQDRLLVTASSELLNCWADWSGLQGNIASNNKIYDLTGNVWEIVKDGDVWRTMGGSFITRSTQGATCQSTFAAVAADYAHYDAGFRCCFSSNPTL